MRVRFVALNVAQEVTKFVSQLPIGLGEHLKRYHFNKYHDIHDGFKVCINKGEKDATPNTYDTIG